MKKACLILNTFKTIVWVLTLGVSFTACSFSLPKSWEEEVLLHDGSKIIATRHISFKGRHEVGQPMPIGESTISFKLPNTNKTISWTSEYAKDLGATNFQLLALHVLHNTPYIVAYPNGCTAYNKWGRPNPPYVFFKYDGKKWQRIPLGEFPTEFKTINIYINLGSQDLKALVKNSPVSAEYIKKKNAEIRHPPEYQTIQRELTKNDGRAGCVVLIPYGGSGWRSLDWFERQPSLVACKKYCEASDVDPKACPCSDIFKGK